MHLIRFSKYFRNITELFLFGKGCLSYNRILMLILHKVLIKEKRLL